MPDSPPQPSYATATAQAGMSPAERPPTPPRTPVQLPAPAPGPTPGVASAPWGLIATALVAALACAGAVLAAYETFVRGMTGQRLDQSALLGARLGRSRVLDDALSVLGLVSIAAIVVATVAVVVLAALRRRLDLVAGALVIVAGANITTQIVKHQFFTRPSVGVDTSLSNSLPSGHTTVAASLAAAAVLVVPGALRAVAALLGAGASTVVGVSTLAAGWHRPSDVVAAVLVAGAWTCLVAAVVAMVAPAGAVRARRAGAGVSDRERPGRVTAAVLAGVGVLALIPAGVAIYRVLQLSDLAEDRRDLLTAYAGGAFGIFAVSALVFAALLFLCAALARTEASGPRAAPLARWSGD